MATLPTAHGAYPAKVENKSEKHGAGRWCSLAELIAVGFQLIPWDGVHACPLVDAEGRIFLVLVGQPDRPSYRTAAAAAYDFIKTHGQAAAFPAEMCHHHCGLFAAINVGLTFGKGQTLPTWLDSKQYTGLTDQLLTNKDITRMATLPSTASFKLWAPQLYDHYFQHNRKLAFRFPDLHRPFPKSVFSCATFNFGHSVWTYRHRDICNLPFGLCAVQALRNFDPKQGGHLVLWDLKLIIEFPAGALICVLRTYIRNMN
ncbi:hypothetical protein B0H14DRAFT_2361731 [Mycena olivaceomarginata]|nr:hypothetical protein B0H14DRAFT_2361731 [Mycena olivaceomarginata]